MMMASKTSTSLVIPSSNENGNNITILKEYKRATPWLEIKPPVELDRKELEKFLEEYSNMLTSSKKKVQQKTDGTSSFVSFSVRVEEGRLEIQQRGLFGWLNFGTKNHPFTIVFHPKMMYGLDLENENEAELGKFSKCLIEMKIPSKLHAPEGDRDKRKNFAERALSQGIKESKFNVDLLEEIFTSSLEESLSEGVARQYVRKSTSYPYLKGKIIPSQLIPDIWTNSGYLNQEVQELNSNIPVNRLLAWCCNHLLNADLGDILSERLTDISQQFKGVEIWGRPNESSLERLEELPAIHSHLQEPVDIAILIAREESHLLQHEGKRRAGGVVVDANLTFEDYVSFIFERAWPGTKTGDENTKEDYAYPDGKGKIFSDKPDIYIPSLGTEGRNIKMTFDAKHSHIKATPEPQNRNQTITAAWSRDCQICGLVFPQGKAKREHFKIWKLSNNTNAPNCYAQISMDPSKLWEEKSDGEKSCITKQQENLKEQLWKLYYYHHVEMKIRVKDELKNSWKGEPKEIENNDKLTGIEEAFEGKQWKESYEMLKQLLSSLS